MPCMSIRHSVARRLRAAFAAVKHPLLHAARVVVPALGIDVEAALPGDYAALLGLLAR